MRRISRQQVLEVSHDVGRRRKYSEMLSDQNHNSEKLRISTKIMKKRSSDKGVSDY
jgi:hypothetical protein